jgi:hypothetical protein
MGYVGETTAMGNALVVGLALIAVALGAILVPRAWEEWSEAALGLWAMTSPWVLGFAGHYERTARGGGHRRGDPGAGAVDAGDRQGIRRWLLAARPHGALTDGTPRGDAEPGAAGGRPPR